jgi:flagellar hook-length control protein FliK
MNAAPPVSQAQPLSDAAQPEAPASAASPTTRAGSQDFAAALNDAGVKPVRKSAANKQQDRVSSGSSLPPAGNQPPVAPQPPPAAKTESLPATVADPAAIVKDAQGGTQGAAPSAIGAASTVPANAAGATAILTSASLTSSTPATGTDASAPVPANATTASDSGRPAPLAASTRTLATPGTSTAATAQLRAGNARTAQPSDATAKQGTITSAKSATLTGANALNDSTLSNGPDATGTDAGAQTVMAAAITQGTSEPQHDPAPSDDSATPDTAVALGAALLSDPAASASAASASAASAPAAVMARAAAASISAAVSAATATAVALAASDAASASAADKRSHSESPDATLSGASNDGSAGAAQLMTSNTSTESAPTPTFKVAAGVDTAQFGPGVADRVSLMMDGNLTSAKLQVNPPALGPIEVRIALQGGHAQVSFSSHSAVTRDALESSSEKLREMLGSQGFSSVGVDISQRSFQERLPQSQAYETAPGGDAPLLAQAPLAMSRSASGLLDAYA